MSPGVIVDYFAGGGGASEGIRRALQRSPNMAINHSAIALATHAKNHPETIHVKDDVWNVHPRRDLPKGVLSLAWFSPSCTHFSRARGGKPVSKQLRASPWVAARVAAQRRPSMIVLENVPEFRKWGPVSKNGEPIKSREGEIYRRFLKRFLELGYVIEDRVLDAADYGAPTHRTRLFLIARCDGQPISWPEPTHGPGRPLPYRTAAECIDWTIPMLSIFATKTQAKAFGKAYGRRAPKRPLAPATMRRIAEGVKRFVLDAPQPFLVQANHGRDINRSRGLDEPMPTIATKHGFGLVVPTFVQTGHGERDGQTPRIRDVQRPFSTIVAGTGGQPALVAAFLTKYYGTSIGARADAPASTVTASGQHLALTALHISRFNGESEGRITAGQAADKPLQTITTEPRFALVASFLTRYFGQSVGASPKDPHPTITAINSTGLVTVVIDGKTYAISDIALRMLTAEELKLCQGFHDSYELVGSNEEQVRSIGNSVPPQLAEAIIRANMPASSKEAA